MAYYNVARNRRARWVWIERWNHSYARRTVAHAREGEKEEEEEEEEGLEEEEGEEEEEENCVFPRTFEWRFDVIDYDGPGLLYGVCTGQNERVPDDKHASCTKYNCKKKKKNVG